jgi:hypothetical protein
MLRDVRVWPRRSELAAISAVTRAIGLAALSAWLLSACGPSAPPSTPPNAAAPAATAAPVAVVSAAAPEPGEQPACGAACAAQPLPNALGKGPAESFGESFDAPPDEDVDVAELLAAPERFGDQALTVRGEVTAVCQARGCWLEVASPAQAAAGTEREGCRVVSERHDWLVPRDSAGATARVRGRVQVRTIPAPQVAHMEAEGGRFANKQADGTAREVRLIASGVALAR